MSSSQVRFPAEAIAALEKGDTIVAIKLVRSANDMDLRTAKQTVDAYLLGGAEFFNRRVRSSHESPREYRRVAL